MSHKFKRSMCMPHSGKLLNILSKVHGCSKPARICGVIRGGWGGPRLVSNMLPQQSAMQMIHLILTPSTRRITARKRTAMKSQNRATRRTYMLESTSVMMTNRKIPIFNTSPPGILIAATEIKIACTIVYARQINA